METFRQHPLQNAVRSFKSLRIVDSISVTVKPNGTLSAWQSISYLIQNTFGAAAKDLQTLIKLGEQKLLATIIDSYYVLDHL